MNAQAVSVRWNGRATRIGIEEMHAEVLWRYLIQGQAADEKIELPGSRNRPSSATINITYICQKANVLFFEICVAVILLVIFRIRAEFEQNC